VRVDFCKKKGLSANFARLTGTDLFDVGLIGSNLSDPDPTAAAGWRGSMAALGGR
jgi:hypothetical protein